MRKLAGIIALMFLLAINTKAQQNNIKILHQTVIKDKKISFRGLSVLNEKLVWISGTEGTIGKSLDGGQTWQWVNPVGYEKNDFRDIQAFSNQKAITMSIASPAYLLLTEDGGKNWKQVYENKEKDIFLDGMDFWDTQNGMVFGDPINHQLKLLRTKDGGQTWNDISEKLTAKLTEGEAGFAASGSSIKTLGKGKVWIVTGGIVSNIYFSADYGDNWQVFPCPIMQGKPSQGAFSIDFFDAENGIVLGGDYLRDKDNSNNVYYTNDGGKTWSKSLKPVSGFRSCVSYLTKKTVIATGTSGTDISYNGGRDWTPVSSESSHVIKANKKLIILAGANSKLSFIKLR